MYVLEVLPETRQVVVGTRDELLQDEVVVGELNWLARPPKPGRPFEVQLRYRAPPVDATAQEVDGLMTLRLAEPRPAITAGQSAVLFLGDRLLGGGRIIAARRGARRGSLSA